MKFHRPGGREVGHPSPPARGRGLKFLCGIQRLPLRGVAPCAGAWIEIAYVSYGSGLSTVAPCAGAWIEMTLSAARAAHLRVAPCAGAWIEMRWTHYGRGSRPVAPCAGAWIEINGDRHPAGVDMSPPARGRGLKSRTGEAWPHRPRVAPCAGAWIEMLSAQEDLCKKRVAPCAGAWIEISGFLLTHQQAEESPPARGRGLKCDGRVDGGKGFRRRPLRGGVD